MGRKGGGRAAFMKAAQMRNDDASSPEDVERKDIVDGTLESLETVGANEGNNVKEDQASEVSPSSEPETKGQMTQRHKREAKALKDKVKRMGKKGKEEGAKLLKDMEERQMQELKALDETSQSSSVEQLTISFYSADIGEQRKTKAQKRREKLAKEELERERRIAEESEAMGESVRESEEKALTEKLALSGLAIKDIPSDGHCLYRSIGMWKFVRFKTKMLKVCDAFMTFICAADQIHSLPDHGAQIVQISGTESNDLDFLKLRKICAQTLRSHKDEFSNFISGNDLNVMNGDSSDDVFEAYCTEVEDSAAWGGQVEIQALSMALQVHVRIHTADMDIVETGSEYASDTSTLNICYLKHAFGLGEHYNSTTRI